jgi:DNA-binding transcriptional ArsR family regulator
MRRLEDELLELVARRLQVIAEPTRIRLIALLEEREATVSALTDELVTTHQNFSKHLGLLYQMGIVTRRKQGNQVWYALADYTAPRLIEQATASVTGYVEELAGIAGLTAQADHESMRSGQARLQLCGCLLTHSHSRGV